MAYTVAQTGIYAGGPRSSTAALFGLQAWTWGFWARRTGTVSANASIIASGRSDNSNGSRDLNIPTDDKLSVWVKGSSTGGANATATNAMSTDWQYYSVSVDWAANPQVTWYATDYPTTAAMAAIPTSSSGNGAGSLGTEATQTLHLLDRYNASRQAYYTHLGPFVMWNRVLTLAEAQQVAMFGPLAQRSGLLAWIMNDQGWTTTQSLTDFVGTAWTYTSTFGITLLPQPGPPVLWSPWSGRRNVYPLPAASDDIVAALTASGVTTAGLSALGLLGSSLAGAGSTSAALTARGVLASSIAGTGSTAAGMTALAQLVASVTGSGAVTSAAITATISAVASIAGTGTVSATATGQLALAAGLVGAGNVSALIGAIGAMASTPSGAASVVATLEAFGSGSMAAGITASSTVSAARTAAAWLESSGITGAASISAARSALASISAAPTGSAALSGSMAEYLLTLIATIVAFDAASGVAMARDAATATGVESGDAATGEVATDYP